MFEKLAYVLILDIATLISINTWNDDTKNHLENFKTKEWKVYILFTLVF